jgi:hypothetical protein
LILSRFPLQNAKSAPPNRSRAKFCSAAISLVFCIQTPIRLEFTPLVLFHALLVSIVPSRSRP